MKPVYNNPIRTNVTAQEKERIDNFCEQQEITISDFLRQAVKYYLNNIGGQTNGTAREERA